MNCSKLLRDDATLASKAKVIRMVEIMDDAASLVSSLMLEYPDVASKFLNAAVDHLADFTFKKLTTAGHDDLVGMVLAESNRKDMINVDHKIN